MTVPSPSTEHGVADASLYAAVYEHVPDGILLLDDNRQCLDANPAARDLLGYSLQELQERTIDDLTIPADRPEIPINWQKLLQQRRCRGLWRALTRPGNILHADTRCQAHIRPGVHLCLFRDSVPPPAEAENQLLRQLLDALPIGLLVTDARQPTEPVLYVNRTMIHLTGISREELLKHSGPSLYSRWAEPATVKSLEHARRNAQSITIELLLPRPPGTYRYWLQLIPLPDTHGQVAYFAHLLIDSASLLSTPQPPSSTADRPIPDIPTPSTLEPAPIATAPHILVAEDEDAVREFIRLVLVQAGYRVTLARDGQEAWELFRCQPHSFDLLISDVLMPRLNGSELIDRVRSVRPQLPMLLISGYTGGTALPLQLQPPLDALLEKPFSIDQLLRAVRTALTAVAVQATDAG